MVQIKTEVRSIFNLEKGPRGQMRQLISSFLAILASILPSESDTTTSGCPYIVNRGKDGEHVCGVMSRSGPLCAEHQKRKPQKHYSHEEAEEKEKENMKSQKKEKEKKEEEKGKGDEMDDSMSRTCKATSEVVTSSQARRGPGSPSATSTPTRPRTRPNKSSPNSSTSTPTSTNRKSTPRPSPRGSTFKAAPGSASTRKLRSSPVRADSTSPTLTGTSGNAIDELTGQLNDLKFISDDDIQEVTGRIEDLHIGDEDGIGLMPRGWEWLEITKSDDPAPSLASYGPRDPFIRDLEKYLMKGTNQMLIRDLIEKLQVFPIDKDREGYVYIVQAIPKRDLQAIQDNKIEQTTPTKKDANSNEKIIVKVGCASDAERRMKTLPGNCRYYMYKPLVFFPEGRTVKFMYKAEQMAHQQLQNWPYNPPHARCLCKTKRHRELFEVTLEELKDVVRCVDHWTTVVNAHHEELWPGAVEMNSLRSCGQ